MARDRALRHRGQSAGLARFTGAPQAAAGRRASHRGIPRPRRPHRLRPVVPGPRRGQGSTGGMEAEHARRADALSGGVPVRPAGADAVAPRTRPLAVRGGAVHRQCRERGDAKLSGAVDQHALPVVAAAGARAADAPQHRRRGARRRALCRDGAGVLAVAVGVGSVSYTHLDVYKRQPIDRRLGRASSRDPTSLRAARCWVS